MNKKIFIAITLMILTLAFISFGNKNQLQVIAIANYGPHASLEAAIDGFKEEMAHEGFIDNKNIKYEIADVGFDLALIPQMITSLLQYHPRVMLLMGTPIAQFAKSKIHDIPLIYNAITDPVEAGLIKDKYKPEANITGSSDMQDLREFLKFAQSILPHAKSIGLLYSTAESNDTSLVKMMKIAAESLNMKVVAIPIEQARDIIVRIQEFQGKVDLIYVGSSGAIQPTLPVIAAEAQKMHIPIFNVETQAVIDGLALASFGVNYKAVGKNAGQLAASLLNGTKISNLLPVYPHLNDYHRVINKRKAAEFNIQIPNNIEIVE